MSRVEWFTVGILLVLIVIVTWAIAFGK